MAVANSRTPSAAVLVTRKTIEAKDLVFPPNLFSRNVYAVFSSPLKYAGRKSFATTILPNKNPNATCKKLRLVK